MNSRGKGTSGDGQRIDNVLKGLIPPYPGASIVPPVVIPPPPAIPKNATDEEAAVILAKAYRSGIKHVLRRNCYSLFRGDITKSKPYKTLVVASKLLRQYNAAPISWAVWSCSVWKKWKGVKSNPPIMWVYGMPRIDGKIDVFRREHSEGTARTALTEKHRILLNRYNELIIELNKLSNTGASEIERIRLVKRYFPSNMYWALVEKINEESELIQKRLVVRIRRGEWVW